MFFFCSKSEFPAGSRKTYLTELGSHEWLTRDKLGLMTSPIVFNFIPVVILQFPTSYISWALYWVTCKRWYNNVLTKTSCSLKLQRALKSYFRLLINCNKKQADAYALYQIVTLEELLEASFRSRSSLSSNVAIWSNMYQGSIFVLLKVFHWNGSIRKTVSYFLHLHGHSSLGNSPYNGWKVLHYKHD